MLHSGQVNIKALISCCLPLKEMSQAIVMIARRDPQAKKVILLPNG